MKKIYLLIVFCCLYISGFAVCVTPPAAITGPTSVCTGNSITLSDGVGGGVWSSTAGSGTATVGSGSGIVNGVTAGTVTISYTTSGCTPATYIITVNAFPNPISGSNKVCNGATITLSDIPSGGVWSSNNSTIASVNVSTGDVTGATAGSTTISYTLAGCGVGFPITVNPIPAIISGPRTVCLGYTVTLSDISGGGTWSSSTSAVGTVGSTSGIVTGIASGATYITYTFISTGCYSDTLMNVLTNPSAISGSSSVCLSYTTSLSDASGGGSWSSSNSAIISVGSATGVTTGNAFGSATITYAYGAGAGGCYVTQLMTVNANPSAISGSSSVCRGDSVTLSDGTAGGTWSSSAFYNASVGSSTGVVTGIIGGGTTTISYTISTGCFALHPVSVITPPSMIMGDSTICVTYSSVLTDSVPGGAWTSSAPGSLIVYPSGVDTAIAPGIVTVFYTITGCPTVSHNVTVNPVPTGITGSSSLCDSVHENFFDLTPGGVWSSHDPIVARIDSASGVATGVSLGTTEISYTLSTGCYIVLPVTVNPLAPPIAGTDTICATGYTWLTDIVGGGIWTSSNPAVATIDPVTGLLTGVVTGVTYIVYTLPTGCSASLLEHAIPAVSPISSPAHICTGSAVTITDPDTAGVWSSSNNYIATIDTNGLLSGHFPDTTNITYTVSAFKGCFATTSVIVTPLPIPLITRNAATHTLSTATYYTSYQWYNNRIGLMPGATNYSVVVPYANDSFYVVVTDTNGCTGRSDWYYYHFTGVNNVATPGINIYPNPAGATLYIESAEQVRAVISTIDGRMIMTQDNAKEMNITALVPGMYLVALYNNEGQMITVQKVVKE